MPTSPPPSGPAVCAACGGSDLRPHLRVAGAAGPEGLTPTTDRFGTALSDIVRCPGCGHMQLDRLPSEAELAAAYAAAEAAEYLEEEAGQRATARAVLEPLERQVEGRRLLDVGAWVGFLLAEARERGWSVRGIEPSDFASAHALERLGLDVATGDLSTAELPVGGFDAVVLGDVIEHLPDPGAALDRIRELLAPRGVVCLMAPDAGSALARALGARWWSVIPTHVHYFTRGSLRTLLARHGFAVVAVDTQPKAFSVRYYLSRVGGYSRTTGRMLVRAAERLGLADRMWAPDFRDRMLVVARRR
ncbi:MAG: class I SAM-dependent methyltransferase [Actinomycetota bacterium]|nr:class I SAM-dependent methyltransferase [Actinomycetota bacterium]